MPQFAWEATNQNGEMKSGTLDSPSEVDVRNRLEGMGLQPTRVKKKAREINIKIPGFGNKVPVKSKVVFVRQLATMIDAGLPLVQCLDILGGQEPHARLREVIMGVKSAVESGTTFSDALGRYPKIFDTLFVNLVAAGEMGGILDTILNRLAAYMEKSMKLRQRVKSAMKYPVTVLAVSLGITIFLLTNVIPSFAEMFVSMGKDLPALTTVVLAVSNATVENLPTVLAVLAVLLVIFIMWKRTDKGGYLWDAFLLKVPIFGGLLKKAAVAKFTRTLGTLISSGVPILDALEIVAKTSGNRVVERGIMYARERIAEGKSIAAPLLEVGVFPKMVVQMVAVGESTGAMDIMLSKIADFYEDEVDASVDAITSLIEPLIMVLLGGIIGVVLLAMYMPIFAMGDAVSEN